MLSLVMAGLLAIPNWMLFRWIARRIRRRASDVISDPKYRPIVVLRSFKDEKAPLKPTSFFRSLFSRYRLEEVVVSRISYLGPPVAIGMPGERLPPLGALRDYYRDDEWQSAVLNWLARADLIVVIVGKSPGALWELNHIARNHLVLRTVLLFPPDHEPTIRSARWAAVTSVFDNTPWSEALSRIEPKHLLAISFAPSSGVQPIYGVELNQTAYDIAIQTAVVGILGNIADAPVRSEKSTPAGANSL